MQAGGTARPLRGQFHVHYSYPALPAAPAGGAAVQQGCLQRHRVSSRPGPGGGGVLGLAAGLGPLAGSGSQGAAGSADVLSPLLPGTAVCLSALDDHVWGGE